MPVPSVADLDDRALDRSLPEVLRRLRPTPVVWLPQLGCWFVTGHREARSVLRRPQEFTVDDPRFSTGQVLGPSMLTLDGEEHRRHRRPFAPLFDRSAIRGHSGPVARELARSLVTALAPRGRADLRTDLAAPLAVATIIDVLGLDADPTTVLTWYRDLAAGVEDVSAGRALSTAAMTSRESLRARVKAAADTTTPLAAAVAGTDLDDDEVFANTAVAMFGAIETSEAMTATCLWHLLSAPGLVLGPDRSPDLVSAAVEESLRLEPAASVVDRYTTTDAELSGVTIPAGALVRVSLTGANRDPSVFDRPEEFDPFRPELDQHLAFVTGPHACLGARLARLETEAAVTAVLDLLPGIALTDAAQSRPTGVIFRKPPSLPATWPPTPGATP